MSKAASHLVDDSYHPGGGAGPGGGVGGNFAGGRKELAMRLLSNCQEEEPSLDTTEEDELPFQRVRIKLSFNNNVVYRFLIIKRILKQFRYMLHVP